MVYDTNVPIQSSMQVYECITFKNPEHKGIIKYKEKLVMRMSGYNSVFGMIDMKSTMVYRNTGSTTNGYRRATFDYGLELHCMEHVDEYVLVDLNVSRQGTSQMA